jgi:hypothetical protein
VNHNPDSSGATPGGMEALRDLTFRLLSERSLQVEDIIVGRLPDRFPADIPILEDSQIIGSQVSSPSTGTRRHFTVILGTDLSPEQAVELYDQRLRAEGWTLPNTGGPWDRDREGFSHALIDGPLNYFNSEQEPARHLLLRAYKRPDGSTEVRLHQDFAPVSAYGPSGGRPRYEPRQIMPSLKPPPEASQTTAGSSSGDYFRNAAAFTETGMDAADLAAFYAEQLRVAGWNLNGEGTSGPISWSAWRFSDDQGDDWAGTLTIVEQPGQSPSEKHNYYLSICAQRI